MGEGGSAAEMASYPEPAPGQARMPEMAAGEMSFREVSAGEVCAGEVSAEAPTTKAPAEILAPETTEVSEVGKASEVTEAPEMTAAEPSEMTEAADVTAAEAPDMTASTAEVTATEMTAAEATAPKGSGFARHTRNHARRKRTLETKSERDRHYENFRQPTSHGRVLLPPLQYYDLLSLARGQPLPMGGALASFNAALKCVATAYDQLIANPIAVNARWGEINGHRQRRKFSAAPDRFFAPRAVVTQGLRRMTGR